MKKRIVYVLLALIFVLSLPLSAAFAQSDPSAGVVDEDGDLVLGELPLFEAGGVEGQVLRMEGESTLVDAGPLPAPHFPKDIVLYTKTPIFYFTQVTGATRYRIEVKNGYTGVVQYTFAGAANCSFGYCKLTPDHKLNPTTLKFLQGKYEWRVRAKVGGSWEGFSDYATFTVISSGFNDTFNSSVGKWMNVTGNWTRVDPGYLKTGGVPGIEAAAIHKNYFLDFDYSVKMKRKLTDATHGVVVWGNASSTNPNNGRWEDGVYFFIRSNQQYAVFQMKAGTLSTLKSYTTSSAIVPFGWNTLRVVADSPNLYLFINGTSVGSVTPTINNEGFVGISMYKNANGIKEPLLVDSAVLVSEQPFSSGMP